MDKIITVIFDCTVLALAEKYESSRTGIYFVISNLLRNLSHTKKIRFSFIVQNQYNPDVNDHLINYLPAALYKLELDCDIIELGKIKANEFVHIFSGFYPINKYFTDNFKFKKIYQLFHDFAGHSCPEFLNNKNFDELRNFELHLLSQIDEVHALCVSKKTANDLKGLLNTNSLNTSVVYPGLNKFIDNSGKSKLLEKNIEIDSYIISISTIEPRKNIMATLNVINILVNIYKSNVRLKIIGLNSQKLNHDIFNFIELNNLKKHIDFLGYIDDELLNTILSNAKLLIYPSFYEGFGLPPMEALFKNIPLILSNRGSLPEIYEGYADFFDPYDYEGMALRSLEILNNPIKKPYITNKLNIHLKYNWNISAATLISHFDFFEPK